MEIMYIKELKNNYFKNKNIIGLFGEEKDLFSLVNNIENINININLKVKRYLRSDIHLLEKLSLNKKILNKRIKELSDTELKILYLIKTISLNPKLIVLNNFEVGINEKYLNTIVRLLKNINNERGIKIIILSNNISFVNKLTKSIIIMKNGIIKYQGDLLIAIEQKLLPKPEIIKFIDIANKKNIKLQYTLDEKELLKDIYRSIN